MVDVGGCLVRKGESTLSKDQQEVLHMLTKLFLTPKEIARRRETTPQAVHKIVGKLKAKGVLTQDYHRWLSNNQIAPLSLVKDNGENVQHPWRLHRMEWNFQILRISAKYHRFRERNTFILEGHTIRLYEHSLEIYQEEGHSFIADAPNRCFAIAMGYWQRLFTKLENRLDILMWKPGGQNFKLCNWHFAETNNELAHDYNQKKQKLNVYASEDSKLWFTIDDSFNLGEAECLKPETALPDANRVRTVFTQYRDHPLIMPLEMHNSLVKHEGEIKSVNTNVEGLMKIQEIELRKMGMYATHLQSHTESVIDLRAGIQKQNVMMQELHATIKMLMELLMDKKP